MADRTGSSARRVSGGNPFLSGPGVSPCETRQDDCSTEPPRKSIKALTQIFSSGSASSSFVASAAPSPTKVVQQGSVESKSNKLPVCLSAQKSFGVVNPDALETKKSSPANFRTRAGGGSPLKPYLSPVRTSPNKGPSAGASSPSKANATSATTPSKVTVTKGPPRRKCVSIVANQSLLGTIGGQKQACQSAAAASGPTPSAFEHTTTTTQNNINKKTDGGPSSPTPSAAAARGGPVFLPSVELGKTTSPRTASRSPSQEGSSEKPNDASSSLLTPERQRTPQKQLGGENAAFERVHDIPTPKMRPLMTRRTSETEEKTST
ncbi:unnamed protein product, partial [Amoebophrya sp. A25]|eukprot:GSA25T00012326001.1